MLGVTTGWRKEITETEMQIRWDVGVGATRLSRYVIECISMILAAAGSQ